MGLESIVSIIPTIGNVLGSLLGNIFKGEENANSVRYSIRLGNSPMDEVDFKIEGTNLVLANRTADPICLSFPAQNGNDGETIAIGSCHKCNLQKNFEMCAKNDVDTFEITAGNVNSGPHKLFASEYALTTTSSGTAIIGQMEPRYIGANTSVVVTTDNVTIKQDGCSGKGTVVNFHLQSAGGSESYKTHNASLDGNGVVKIALPLVLKEGEVVHIGVTIGYVPDNYEKWMDENNRKYGVVQMTKEEIVALEKATNVNHA